MMKKIYFAFCGQYRRLKEQKTLVLSIICSKGKNEDEKIFEEEESMLILKILCLIENI